MTTTFIQLSLAPMLIALLAGLACALPGNFLVLRRQSLIGDAISHVVLLGVVGAFVITGSLAAGPMLAAAACSAILAVGLIDAIQRLGRIEPGAAMGVVFTAMFALAVFWLEQSHSSSVHLDVEHVLFGNLESQLWLDATGWSSLIDPTALRTLPPAIPRLIWTNITLTALIVLFWRPLAVSTFDPGFAASTGARPQMLGIGLLSAVALATVSALLAVGAIIVVSMLICPAASARLVTNRLSTQVILSLAFAATATTGGYMLAAWGPHWLGQDFSVSAAGMIAAGNGLLLLAASLFGPCRRRTG